MQLFQVVKPVADIAGIAVKPEQYRPFIRTVDKPPVQQGAVFGRKEHVFITVQAIVFGRGLEMPFREEYDTFFRHGGNPCKLKSIRILFFSTILYACAVIEELVNNDPRKIKLSEPFEISPKIF